MINKFSVSRPGLGHIIFAYGQAVYFHYRIGSYLPGTLACTFVLKLQKYHKHQFADLIVLLTRLTLLQDGNME